MFVVTGYARDLETPEQLIAALEQVVIDNDTEHLLELYSFIGDDQPVFAQNIERLLIKSIATERARNGGLQAIDIQSIIITQPEQNTAKASLRLSYKRGQPLERTIDLVKVNQQWKLRI